MHLRAIQAVVDPGRLDEAIRYVEEDVRRTAKEQRGYRALAMGVDRATGRHTVVTFWDDREAERAADEAMKGMRQGAAGWFGFTVESITVAELLAMHVRQQPRPGCWNRVSVLDVAAAEIDAALETFTTSTLPALEAMDGFCAAMLCADRDGGRAIAVTTWRDHGALKASQERANSLREEVRDKTHGQILDIAEMEVAIAAALT